MPASKAGNPVAHCKVAVDSDKELRIALSGRLTARDIGPLWKDCEGLLKSARGRSFVIDAGGIDHCDGSGVGLLSFLLHTARQYQSPVEIVHLRDEFSVMLERFGTPLTESSESVNQSLNAIQATGKLTLELLEDMAEQVTFLARVLITGLRTVMRPWRFRWNDFFYIAEHAGVQAFGIVSMLGFLFGLIISFSSAMPLRQFGVEIYVADLVAYAMVRVMGPIITAIIVAGRTGSAYAAELGTMKINHEIDALQMMNLDPVGFLVLPRVLATTLMTPLLAVTAGLWGMAGSAVLILSLGYPVITYTSHVQSILTAPDIVVGLAKAVVYGAMIGMVGCLRGMQTKIGAGAVGISTTRAVVTSIVLLVLLEGLFSIVLYFLDI